VPNDQILRGLILLRSIWPAIENMLMAKLK